MNGVLLDWLLLGEAAVLLLVLARRQRWLHPTTLFAAFWTLTLAVRIFAPMRQAPMNDTAALIFAVGIAAVCAPALFGSRPGDVPDDIRLGDRGVALWRLIVLTCAAGAAVAVGLYLFRAHVSEFYVGADFGNLSAEAVRAAQNEGDRGGPLTLLFSLAPLLGALGIYGALRYSRLWFLATLLALAATLQSPARITTLGLVVTCATFYAYARPLLRRDPDAPVASARVSGRGLAVRLMLAAAAGLAYFSYTSQQLGKDAVAAVYATGWTWPDWLLSPVQYLVGGVAGLTATVAAPAAYQDPFDSTGQSIYLLMRVLGQHPNTLAEFTRAPFPINVFTGFGNMWFDFGLLGVLVLSLLLGWLAQRAFRDHQARLEWAWVAAVVANVLVSTGMAFRLFSLDVIALLACGWLAFSWLRRAEPLPGTHASEAARRATSRLPRTSSPGTRTPTG